MAVDVGMPQLIDPALDYLTFLALKRLKLNVHMYASLEAAFNRLTYNGPRACKPLMVVCCTDSGSRSIDDLRFVALAAKVPVIHALERTTLGLAAGLSKPVSAVVITKLPKRNSVEVKQLLALMLAKASDACQRYVDLMSPVSPPLAQPLPPQLPPLAQPLPPQLPPLAQPLPPQLPPLAQPPGAGKTFFVTTPAAA